ncbi:glycosyltransferase family A protein [Algoriphagus sp. NG3]|uniref:glycosyltransferase family A protein n=1 Tax=Algoriphagus sp. NG3 TaxID=3097546 RepID=UPI002A83CDDC|nr:glycosyltransferase family A protein [Algoriphagus sp. NG3]WPR77813.1 glycosyltransferase family A protein [Algoriphagus sp. NG3]
MRVGENPNKNIDSEISSVVYHRVIIPVYIPNLNDSYFKSSMEILRFNLESLLFTIHGRTRITVVDNGCCDEVREYLKKMYNDFPLFDQLFHSKTNLGKINAVYSGIKSNTEELITVTDADVMFKPGWQHAVEEIFHEFPEAGMVSPVPHSMGFINFSNATTYYGLFKGKLYFDTVRDPEDLKKFENSIQRNILKPIHYRKYLVVDNGRAKGVMGCGHFVATYRREVFSFAPNFPARDFLSTRSDNDYLDMPNDQGGFLRMATLNNYGYHLGNVHEPWMELELKKIKEKPVEELYFDLPVPKPLTKTQYKIGWFFNRLLLHKFRKRFFKSKGVTGY